MPLSVVDIYKNLLPKTNCGDCGFPTCLAFASMVVAEQLALEKCPHIDSAKLQSARQELEDQYAAGKWTRRDMAADALQWARERAASMQIADLPPRIGGSLIQADNQDILQLPYFTDTILIKPGEIMKQSGESLNRWEQVFIYNHMAQGGFRQPTGKWKGLVELPNTVSKMKSMKEQVEQPLIARFGQHAAELLEAGKAIGGESLDNQDSGADVAMLFRPLPRIPMMLQFWDSDPAEGFEAEAKLLFDETITEHLDIESIIFLSERLRQLLCGEEE